MQTDEPTPAESPPEPSETGVLAIREAILEAIGELSQEERERLTASEQPQETVRVWRELIAERAAREREQSLRRELQSETLAAQPQPTRGLHTAVAPAAAPDTVEQWTNWIRGIEDSSEQARRRADFAAWLASHPEA